MNSVVAFKTKITKVVVVSIITVIPLMVAGAGAVASNPLHAATVQADGASGGTEGDTNPWT